MIPYRITVAEAAAPLFQSGVHVLGSWPLHFPADAALHRHQLLRLSGARSGARTSRILGWGRDGSGFSRCCRAALPAKTEPAARLSFVSCADDGRPTSRCCLPFTAGSSGWPTELITPRFSAASSTCAMARRPRLCSTSTHANARSATWSPPVPRKATSVNQTRTMPVGARWSGAGARRRAAIQSLRFFMRL